MKITIDDFILNNKGWTFTETIEKAGVGDEIEYHKSVYGIEPTKVYIMPMFMALDDKYDKPYYNNKHTMILMPC